MKKGRKYIEPMTGRGDEKNEAAAEIKDTKKATPKVGASGKTWDGVSRPSNDMYRDAWDRIFGEKNAE